MLESFTMATWSEYQRLPQRAAMADFTSVTADRARCVAAKLAHWRRVTFDYLC